MSEPTTHEPLSAGRWAEIRDIAGIDSDPHTYQQTVTLALRDVLAEWAAAQGMRIWLGEEATRLRTELDHTRDVLAAHLALESADAAAGSYAGRAEEAEAERDRLRAKCVEQREHLAELRDERDWAITERDCARDELATATTCAEQAEAALAELREWLREEWTVRRPDGTINASVFAGRDAQLLAENLAAANLRGLNVASVPVQRFISDWRVPSATPRPALERATVEQDVQPETEGGGDA